MSGETLTFNRKSPFLLRNSRSTYVLETVRAITEFRMSLLHSMKPIPLINFGAVSVEVAIHTILYARQVYPVDLFVRRKKYDTPVFKSRHPALNEYIAGAVKAVGEELALVRRNSLIRWNVPDGKSPARGQGNVDKVVVVIKDKDHIALERFIFAVQSMLKVEPYDKDTKYSLHSTTLPFDCISHVDWPGTVWRKLCLLKPSECISARSSSSST
jgi:hypothetical protein